MPGSLPAVPAAIAGAWSGATGIAVAIAGIPSVARTGPPAARTQRAAAAGSAVDGALPAAAVAVIPRIAGARAARTCPS